MTDQMYADTLSQTRSQTLPETQAEVAIASMQAMAHGTFAELDRLTHPEAVNREAVDEPPAASAPGAAGFWATALWLRTAFSDLTFEIHEVVEVGDLVVVHNTMSGRHTGDFVGWDDGTDQGGDAADGAGVRESPRRTGCGSATGWSSSTGPTATTSAWPSSSAGRRPARRSCSGRSGRPGGPAACWRASRPAQKALEGRGITPGVRDLRQAEAHACTHTPGACSR